jgi:antirestriction protein ArdC
MPKTNDKIKKAKATMAKVQRESNGTVTRLKGKWVEKGLPELSGKGEELVKNKLAAMRDEVIKRMEAGVLPWRNPAQRSVQDTGSSPKPTKGNVTYTANPKSVASGNPYFGINNIRLSLVTALLEYTSNWYGTVPTWQHLHKDLMPKQGSVGMPVYMWVQKYTTDDNGKEIEDGGFFKTHNVFNLDDIQATSPEAQKFLDDLRAKDTDEIKVTVIPGKSVEIAGAEKEYCPELDNLPRRLGVKVKQGEFSHGSFCVADKTIRMPWFNECQMKGWYSTLIHECVHSTGIELKRDLCGQFGSDSYAREELVAELATLTVMGVLGIVDWEGQDSINNSTAYLSHWLKAMKAEPAYLENVMADAGKASRKIIEALKVEEE